MRYCLALTLLLGGWSSNAQQSFFSQHTYAIPETAPAMIGIDGYLSATLLYKNQKLVGADHLISTLLFAKYPIINHKNNRLVLGVTFTENKIKGPGKLTEQLMSSTLAYSFNYAKNAGVSFAMDFGLVTKKINLDDIQTGAMWTIENGFDPGLSSGENIENEKLIHPKLNASIYWFANDRNKDVRSYFGLSLFQLNSYNDSFYNKNDRINNMQFTALGGFRMYDYNKVALTPKFIFNSTTSGAYLKLGVDFNYSLANHKNNVSRKENSFNVELNYQIKKGAQFGLQYLQPQYIIGMAYHIDVSKNGESNVFNNAVEVLFVFRNPVEISTKKNKFRRTKKKRLKKKNAPKNKKPSKVVNTPLDTLEIPMTNLVDTTSINNSPIIVVEDNLENDISKESWESIIKLGNENKLQFDYNSTQIDETSYKKLKGLALLLKNYKNASIILIGYTDNIGSVKSNKAFSVKRANSAAKVLIELGVPSSKIIIQGKGELDPIDTNYTESGRRKNRRIEFYVINN